MKVLIAHKPDESNKVIDAILSEAGYEIVFIEQSAEVIDKVYTVLPDIIILCIQLDPPGALEILEKLKAAPSTRDIPVILIASRKTQQAIAEGYRLGAFDYISEPYFREEILSRIKNIAYVCERVNELERLIDRDYLTGLYNRKFFMERFFEELAWALRYREPLSLMMFDIDHFKKINDTYGHSSGDEVLKQLAVKLQSALRTEDIVARYGGEEFIALLPNTDTENALTAGERVRSAVSEKEFMCEGGISLPVTVSIGVTTFSEGMDPSSDKIISEADTALYDAKNGGRDRVVVFSH